MYAFVSRVQLPKVWQSQLESGCIPTDTGLKCPGCKEGVLSSIELRACWQTLFGRPGKLQDPFWTTRLGTRESGCQTWPPRQHSFLKAKYVSNQPLREISFRQPLLPDYITLDDGGMRRSKVGSLGLCHSEAEWRRFIYKEGVTEAGDRQRCWSQVEGTDKL